VVLSATLPLRLARSGDRIVVMGARNVSVASFKHLRGILEGISGAFTLRRRRSRRASPLNFERHSVRRIAKSVPRVGSLTTAAVPTVLSCRHGARVEAHARHAAVLLHNLRADKGVAPAV
jgi:hypothetical protein